MRDRVISRELTVTCVVTKPAKRRKRKHLGLPPHPPERRAVLDAEWAWSLFKAPDGLGRWLAPRVTGDLELGRDLEVGDEGTAEAWRYENEGVTDIMPDEHLSTGPVCVRQIWFSRPGPAGRTSVELSMAHISDGTLRFTVREEWRGLRGDGNDDAFAASEKVWAQRFERLHSVLKAEWPEC